MKSINFVEEAVHASNRCNYILLPLSDCNCLVAKFESQKFAVVVVNKEHFFTIEEIKLCKKVHRVKEIKENIQKEKNWFEKVEKCRVPYSRMKIDQEKLAEFQSILFDGIDGVCANKRNPRLLISDLALLVGNQWISLEIMEEFIPKINSLRSQSIVISLAALKDIQKSWKLAENVGFWRNNGIESLCIIANVGKNKLNETYFAINGLGGNHWACFLIEFQTKNIIYCDSLAWDPPHDFILKLEFLTSLIIQEYGNCKGFDIHVVNKSNEKSIFVFQGPNQNICGLACLISAIVITDTDIRSEILLRNKLPNELFWLNKLYNYTDFARYLFIKWYLEKKIALDDLVFNVSFYYSTLFCIRCMLFILADWSMPSYRKFR